LNRTNNFTPDAIISGCTAAIQSPGAAGAWAYGNLGSAYALKGDYDRAIANFTQAIKLKPNDPKYAAAHYNRGMAYRSKGYMTEAQALAHV
jgi:tetratricopeptide (TPR) repeat protein